MQQINAAYQLIVQFIEDYRYDLVASAGPEDLQKWWADRFATGVWGPPPPKEPKARTIDAGSGVLLLVLLLLQLAPAAAHDAPPRRTSGKTWNIK